jgi:mRNA interferase MazF
MIKGEIWWANLPTDPYGSEPGKRRPVLIIQSDTINRSKIKTIICAVITSNINQAQVTGNILLEKSITGLDKTSVINFSQILTIDKTRFIKQISMLPKNYIIKINESIRYIFNTEL